MSLHNINDPEGVKALLDTLRNSQAWANALESGLVQTNPTTQPPADRLPAVPASGPRDDDAEPPASIRPSSVSSSTSNGTPPSVADLLSQLRASQSLEPTPNHVVEGDRTFERSLTPPDHTNTSSESVPQTAPTHASQGTQPQQDIRSLSFQQALPHISRLMEDPHVVENLTKMKEEQDKLERQLWEERLNIRRSYEEKVKVAKNKEKLIGVRLSKQEAQSMSDAFRLELRKFDTERVLPAWDGLVRGQQARLEALNVPTMFVTGDDAQAGDAQKQLRVVRVLEDILSTSQ